MSSRRDCSTNVSFRSSSTGHTVRTDTQVRVDAGIAGGTSQVLVLSIRDMEVRLGVAVLLGQTEVDNVDLVAALADAHEDVIWLDVAVDERLGVYVLDTGDELVGQQQHRLQGELAVAEIEEILQGRAEQVQDHGVVVALGAEPAHERDADAAGERLVDAGFILELGVLGLDALELDGDLLARDDVGACVWLAATRLAGSAVRTEVDVAEGAAANLAADSVLVANAEILPWSASSLVMVSTHMS
jgi:hypothetical protein